MSNLPDFTDIWPMVGQLMQSLQGRTGSDWKRELRHFLRRETTWIDRSEFARLATVVGVDFRGLIDQIRPTTIQIDDVLEDCFRSQTETGVARMAILEFRTLESLGLSTGACHRYEKVLAAARESGLIGCPIETPVILAMHESFLGRLPSRQFTVARRYPKKTFPILCRFDSSRGPVKLGFTTDAYAFNGDEKFVFERPAMEGTRED